MSSEMSIFFDILNIAVAAFVVFVGFQASLKANGKNKLIIQYATVTALIIGLIELTGFLQVFPRDSLIQDMLYEMDLVISLLLYAIIAKAKSN